MSELTEPNERPTVLVTGGAGYIGSHTCKALDAAGYAPVVLDNLGNGHAWSVQWGPLEIGDLLDQAFLDAVLARHRPEAVIHFAAYAYVGESVQAPARYYRNNVAGSLSLLESLVAHQVSTVVFSSSCATYGVPDSVPIGEEQRQAPINPYGASKLMVERMLADFEIAYHTRYVALRYFNAAGADPDGEIGEAHDPETHLVPLAIEASFGERPYLDVYGSDYPTADGTAVRDYVHVSDLANAHVRALRYLRDGGASVALNLGTGHGHSVKQVIEMVERIGDRTVPVRLRGRRPGDPPELVADPHRAREVLSWSAERSSLSSVVETAFRWHQRRWRRERQQEA